MQNLQAAVRMLTLILQQMLLPWGQISIKCVSTLALNVAFSTETLDTSSLKKIQTQILLGRASANVGTVWGL